MKKTPPNPSTSDLLRGNTRTLVLSILKDGPAHGYGIATELELRSNQLLEFKQATLYPLLHNMEEEGLIASEWEMIPGGRPKRIYTITEKGTKELKNLVEAFHQFSTTMYRIVGLNPLETGS